MKRLVTDDAFLQELGTRVSATRLARNQTQAALAKEAGIAKRTLERIESGQSAQMKSFIRVLRALHMHERLFSLLPAAEPGPIELLNRRGKARQRASVRKPKCGGHGRGLTTIDRGNPTTRHRGSNQACRASGGVLGSVPGCGPVLGYRRSIGQACCATESSVVE